MQSKSSSDLMSHHPPATQLRDHHSGPSHGKEDLTQRNPYVESLDRDQKLKRHEEHHPD